MEDYYNLLSKNMGIIIIKFGAEWCGPCKRIESQLYSGFNQMPINNVLCVVIDIDASPEIYGFMKKKRILNGVPGILAYYNPNRNYIPDDCVFGANTPEIDLFFRRCYHKAYGLH